MVVDAAKDGHEWADATLAKAGRTAAGAPSAAEPSAEAEVDSAQEACDTADLAAKDAIRGEEAVAPCVVAQNVEEVAAQNVEPDGGSVPEVVGDDVPEEVLEDEMAGEEGALLAVEVWMPLAG